MNKLTRREALSGLATLAVVSLTSKSSFANSPISWTEQRGDESDFFRAPVLLTGQNEAILIDGSFNYSAGAAMVEEIKATGKRLTTIYVTVNDPDYYFSLKPIAEAFPEARVIAASETLAKIKAKVEGKLAAWGPVLGENGPQTIDDVVLPEADNTSTLTLEGETIEIVTSVTMPDRRYLWVPSIRAVFGGVYAFQDLHVWVADTPKSQDRANWIAELDALISRNPDVVIAGHAVDAGNNGVESLIFTRNYLRTYEEQVAKAADSAALIQAMQRLYPNLGLFAALEIGAKVSKGEMSWG